VPLRRDVVLANLRRVFSDTASAAEIGRLAAAHYGHLWRLAGAFIRFPWMSEARKKALGRVDNLDALVAAADARLVNGVSKSTVNRDMAAVKQVLKAAARWFHENGQPWLTAVPEVPRCKLRCTATEERAITWDEQRRLSQALPAYLATMTLFAVNTGARRGEVLELRWGWEVQNHSAFLIPPQFHKTGASIGSRLLVCNSVAWAVIEEARGRHAEFVFTHHSKPVRTFYGRAWKQARSQAGLNRVRVHDLRHTFATRLEGAGVSRSDVAEMLGHATSSVTRRYIAPDISRLLHEAEKVVAMRHEPVLRIVG